MLRRERDEYLLALQRTQADFENYRKRIQRMQEEQSARAASALVTKLLPVLDTLDLAQAHQTEVERGERRRQGIDRRRAPCCSTCWPRKGWSGSTRPAVPFDPAVHDAVAHATATASGGER